MVPQRHGQVAPHLWIATDETLQQCWMWEHETFRDKLELHRTSKGPVLAFPVDRFPVGCGIDDLVERIVGWAETNGFYPRATK
jgi:hypothetical protein